MQRLNGYRMRLVLIGFVAAIVLGGGGSAKADDTWLRKSDMPITRYGFSTSVVSGKIYAIGGLGDLRRVDEYDPRMNTWTNKTDMPTGREFVSTSVVNEKIYVIGGKSGQPISAIEVYDPVTDTWAMQTELPSHRMWLSTSVVDGIIYVIGGSDANWDGMTHLDTVEAYDPATDTWTPKAGMHTGRSIVSTCVVEGKIYAVGGWAPGATAAVEAYDPATDTWTRKAPMPTARYSLDTSVVGGKIYAIGGWRHSAAGPLYSAVEVYDPETDTWTKGVDIPVPTAGLSTSVVNGKIYAIGGALTTHNGTFIHTSAVYEYEYEIEPVVDFNGDGIVDCADMCIMVDYWHTDYPPCDIAPWPSGDGIVDVQDLILLSEHLFEEIFPPELIAYWKLDETEGYIAYNSIGDNHGILSGNPTWQPDSGQVAGALEFDGIDDYVSTPYIISPADGDFSVFAWIKSGAAGHVILSQAGSVNWLMADAIDGVLRTDLKEPGTTGRNVKPAGPPLICSTVVTDGDWHHVGFVRDGSDRILYVDDIEVARDIATNLEASGGGLYIGAGCGLEPGTFFSGLIDDVRIYNRVVSP